MARHSVLLYSLSFWGKILSLLVAKTWSTAQQTAARPVASGAASPLAIRGRPPGPPTQSTYQGRRCTDSAMLSALGVPISWRKAQLGANITWCGWTFNFDCETVRLTAEKLAKLRAQLKKLESGLGLLMWATSTARHLRPYLAPLYKDLHSARGTLKQIHHSQWQPFLDSLNQEAVVSRQPIRVWLPLHARSVAVGSTDVRCKADIPNVPPAHKAQWIRIADPRRAEIHLRDDSRDAIDRLEACFSHDRLRSLRQRPLLQCYAAADAMAQGDTVGIGWIVTANSVAWFSEQYRVAEVRSMWPALQDTAQKYIACFETLAQLALAMLARSTCAAWHWSFTLPAASDNAPTEAGLDKLWSTAEPLGTCLKLAAAWAAKHHVDFQVTHLAGEKNTWADALSRNKPSVFAHRTAQRRRFSLATFTDALGCVTLHPPGAAWSDELRAAKHPQLSEKRRHALLLFSGTAVLQHLGCQPCLPRSFSPPTREGIQAHTECSKD